MAEIHRPGEPAHCEGPYLAINEHGTLLGVTIDCDEGEKLPFMRVATYRGDVMFVHSAGPRTARAA